jgi:hypothetical protein
MNKVIKVLLATIVVAAPLLSASIASANYGYHGRYSRGHYGGWGRGPVAFDCSRGCDQYVNRWDDGGRFRGNRFVSIRVTNCYQPGDEYRGSVRVIGGDIDDDTQIGIGKDIDDDTQIGIGKDIDDDTQIGTGKDIDDDTQIGTGKDMGDDTQIGNDTQIGDSYDEDNQYGYGQYDNDSYGQRDYSDSYGRRDYSDSYGNVYDNQDDNDSYGNVYDNQDTGGQSGPFRRW